MLAICSLFQHLFAQEKEYILVHEIRTKLNTESVLSYLSGKQVPLLLSMSAPIKWKLT